MTTALLGLVIVGLLPGFQSVKFIVRTMAVGCLLSILWVVLFPETAIHQLSDPYQTVHAGLWRGVFSHKQGLGYFSGLTVGLLLFYRTSIFSAPVWAFFLVCSVICLIGSGSATGMVATVIAPAFLFMAYFIARLPLPFRQPMVVKFAIGVAIIGLAFRLGILNYVIVQILGKSTDLTGRADFWPIILQNFYASGHSFLGGGFGAKIAADMSEWSVDNGYVDKFLEFGYLITPLIFGIFVLILWKGIRLVVANPGGQTSANIFPFAVWCVTLILNITESNFMTKCLSTVLTSVAVGLIVQQLSHLREGSGSSFAASIDIGRSVPASAGAFGRVRDRDWAPGFAPGDQCGGPPAAFIEFGEQLSPIYELQLSPAFGVEFSFWRHLNWYYDMVNCSRGSEIVTLWTIRVPNAAAIGN